MSWTGNVTRVGEVRKAQNILVGRQEGKRPFGRLKNRW